ncbi:Arginase/deacetylase [Mollisia scopiformis]|uniref:Arginase/deacetylase n=1 Tax=Mollisia scopiformis TaxID=149040 RepID=A0A194X8S9_MOLSC|nr:Arginase/deacetylase [Mollisia scopiformis]KUJ16575.1 Arginase/deacetylase [Mollisia scopiformis]
MSQHISDNNMSRETAPLPSSINNYDSTFAQSLKRLSISAASATALPSSPQSPHPGRTLGRQDSSSASPNGRLPPRSPLHRSPSSMSQRSRSSTPTLLRKASLNSLHGVGGVTPSRTTPSRRSSSAQFANASAMVGKSPLSEIEDPMPAPPRHTAESIASNHFRTELDIHEKEDEARSADTVVILHDSCYGHRYSRPRTSKASLSTIVERPERIHASILGLSVAYVRLGERHAEGQYPLHPDKDASSIPTIPFRICKTTRRLALGSQAVTNVHGMKWMEELKIMCDNAESRLAMNGKELVRPDMVRSPDQEVAKLHEGDLYLCAESLDAMEGALGAVCDGVDAVFQGAASGKGPHRTFVAIRPPGHHCSASYPSGFCWLNNVHVGISHAALTHGLTHAAIIDFDLHHGDGSQAIAWDANKRAIGAAKNAAQWKKTSIGYFSLHDINSYPCEMGDEEKVKNASLCIENAHGQSIWNVHLQPWKSEIEFWQLYETKYSILLEKTRNYLRAQTDRLRMIPNGPKPKGAIFLSAGFDASEWESSGMQRHKVNVPTEFYARLTRDVVKLAAEEGNACDGRIISVLEGGYSDRALCTGVLSHLSGMSAGDPIIIKKELSPNGLGYEMGQKINTFEGVFAKEDVTVGTQTYDKLWWSVPRLEQLDALIRPTPMVEPKKPRDATAPTYSSPTQSFIAKVTSPEARRTVSRMGISNGSPKPVSRAPSPPPPEVDWTVAAHELSKLLIPIDRQTMSCRPEDLSAEATRVRRDRQSILTPPTSAAPEPTEGSGRMALRTRKPRALAETIEEDEKPATKANRRKTVAGAAVIAAEKAVSRSTTPMPEPSYAKGTTQSNRRLSLSSNAGSVTSEVPRQNGHRASSGSGPVGASRPGTAQSTRPDTSMSSRGGSIPPIAMKKTRAPAVARGEAPKTSRVRKKSPLNETNAVPGPSGSVQPTSRSSSVVLPTTEIPDSQGSDMDSLTSGMKKVKISLTTKAQREAKQAAKPAPVKSTAGKAVKPRPAEGKVTDQPPILPGMKPVPVSEAVPSSANGTTTEQPVEQVLAPTPSTPQPSLPAVAPALQASEVPLPSSSPAAPQYSPITPAPEFIAPIYSAPPSDNFIPYQPEGPTPNPVTQQQHLHWLPPNTNTPSPVKRGDLPVFTSTSAIPFGLNPRTNGEIKKDATEDGKGKGKEEEKEVDIWAVPETPEAKRPLGNY